MAILTKDASGEYDVYDYRQGKTITCGGGIYAQSYTIGSCEAASIGFGFCYGTEQVVATVWD
jgi:hypothetical protein